MYEDVADRVAVALVLMALLTLAVGDALVTCRRTNMSESSI